MGNCNGQNNSEQKHPILGNLVPAASIKNHGCMKVTVDISNEGVYTEWVKLLNRTKCNLETRNYLLFPQKHCYLKNNVFCSVSDSVEVHFKAYVQTMEDFMAKRHKPFPEKALWYILLVWAHTQLFFNRRKETIGCIGLQNLLIGKDKQLKVIWRNVIPQTLNEPEREVYMVSGRKGGEEEMISNEREKEQSEEIYLIGVCMLGLANLKNPKEFTRSTLKSSLKLCSNVYSPSFCEILSGMLETSSDSRLSAEAIYKKLQAFEQEVIFHNLDLDRLTEQVDEELQLDLSQNPSGISETHNKSSIMKLSDFAIDSKFKASDLSSKSDTNRLDFIKLL